MNKWPITVGLIAFGVATSLIYVTQLKKPSRTNEHAIADTQVEMEAITQAISQYSIAIGHPPGILSNGVFHEDFLLRDLTNNSLKIQFASRARTLNGRLVDRWKNPIRFEWVTNTQGDVRFYLWSKGPDQIDQNRGGDDIVIEGGIFDLKSQSK